MIDFTLTERQRRPLLIGYDGSEHAKDAIRSAAGLFAVKDALVVTVWQPTSDLGAFAWYGAGPDLVNFAELDRAGAEAVRQDISRQSDRPPLAPRATIDRLLELVERRKLSVTELRVLLALLDRGAGLPELAEALDRTPDEITRAGRCLSTRGLIRWHHVGSRERTRLEITGSGLTTVRALVTAASLPL